MMNVQTNFLYRTRQTTKNLFAKYWFWAYRVASAVADQGIFAITNFIINIMLARWLTTDGFGAFVVAYAWFLLPNTIWEAIMLEPLTFFASGKYSRKFKKYIGFTFYLHLGLSIVMVAIIGLGAIAAYFLDSQMIASALMGAALASPFLTVRQLSRTPFYVTSQPNLSALGGVVYLFTAIPTLFLLRHFELLTAFSALIGMSVAAFFASAFLTVVFLKPEWSLKDEVLRPKQVLLDHWNFGIWAVPKRLLQWIPGNLYLIVLPGFAGLTGSGTLSALANLTMPIFMANSAISSVLLPTLVRSFRSEGKAKVNQRLRSIVLAMFIGTMTYGFVLLIFGKQIMHLIYRGQFDDEITFPILLTMAFIPMITSVSTVLAAGLQSMGWVKLVFKSRLLPTFLTTTVGVLLLKNYGILGANIGSLGTATIALLTLLWFYIRQMRSDEISPLNGPLKPKASASEIEVEA